MKECFLDVSTPHKAPVDVLFAIAKMSDTEVPYIPMCMRGWQCGGIVDLESGEPVYDCPKGIAAVWLSLTERKVYEIDVDFSNVLKERVDHLLQKGFVNKRGENVSYTHLTFSLFPEGLVRMHLVSCVKTLSLDYVFQGIETSDYDVDFLGQFGEVSNIRTIDDYCDIYFDDDEYVVEDEENDLQDNTAFVNQIALPNKLWEKYYKRYDYKIRFVFEDSESSLFFWSPKFTNSESFSCLMGVNDNVIVKHPSIITSLNLWWRDEDCHYTSFFYFDEDEIIPLFEKAFSSHPDQKGMFVIAVSEYNNLFDISLHIGNDHFPLHNTQIRVFCDELYDSYEDVQLLYKNYDGNHNNHFYGL